MGHASGGLSPTKTKPQISHTYTFVPSMSAALTLIALQQRIEQRRRLLRPREGTKCAPIVIGMGLIERRAEARIKIAFDNGLNGFQIGAVGTVGFARMVIGKFDKPLLLLEQLLFFARFGKIRA